MNVFGFVPAEVTVPALIGAATALVVMTIERFYTARQERSRWQLDDKRRVYAEYLRADEIVGATYREVQSLQAQAHALEEAGDAGDPRPGPVDLDRRARNTLSGKERLLQAQEKELAARDEHVKADHAFQLAFYELTLVAPESIRSLAHEVHKHRHQVEVGESWGRDVSRLLIAMRRDLGYTDSD